MSAAVALPPEEQLVATSFTTYKLGGLLQQAYRPASIEALEAWLEVMAPRLKTEGPPTVLGWGSNTVLSSNGVAGLSLITRKLTFIEPLEQPGAFRIGAGVHLAKVASLGVEAGCSGSEFFIGIPGTMGGAVKMNAGAMGQETAEVVKQVLVMDWQTLDLSWWPAERLNFSYRHSTIHPGRHLVVAADCYFTPGDVEAAKKRMQANMAFRKTHHPIEPNAGSVFRNPDDAPPVGKIIDELGGRGVWANGDAVVSPIHGNFIINRGQATSTDILRVMLQMKEAVAKAYDVEIFPENRLLGDVGPEDKALWAELKGNDTHGD